MWGGGSGGVGRKSGQEVFTCLIPEPEAFELPGAGRCAEPTPPISLLSLWQLFGTPFKCWGGADLSEVL